jgi:hypothetical protein
LFFQEEPQIVRLCIELLDLAFPLSYNLPLFFYFLIRISQL